jgi:hypothetical protein
LFHSKTGDILLVYEPYENNDGYSLFLRGEKIFRKICAFLWFLCYYNLDAVAHISDFSLQLDCGYYNNRALYATFGFERHIFTCREVLAKAKLKQDNHELYIEWAPVYNSMRIQRLPQQQQIIYETIIDLDGTSIPIDGANRYVDWYKNFGDRIFSLDASFPFRQLYLEIVNFKLGRQINALGFSSSDVSWGDSGWFSPMAFMLSKDLYTGLTYTLKPISSIAIIMELMNGSGNPTKDNLYYFDNPGASNYKNNNTPLLGINISFDYSYLLFTRWNGKIFAGYEHTTMGSTWRSGLSDGKHKRNVLVIGGDVVYNYWENNQIRLYGQYTEFVGGLSASSAQNNGHPLFGNIKKCGFFIGGKIGFLSNNLQMDLVYEKIDRWDFGAQLYQYGLPDNSSILHNLQKWRRAKQESFIFHVIYHITSSFSLVLAYHHILNPLGWISGILPSKGEQKMELSLLMKF